MRRFTTLLVLIFVFVFIAFDVAPEVIKEIKESSYSNEIVKADSLLVNTSINKEFLFPEDDVDRDAVKWADSVYNLLTLEQKIGQLFMVAAYSNKNEAHARSIDSLIINQAIGGVIFFQGGPVRQAKLTNRFQSKSKVPLFIGIDAEWGLAMRLDSTYRFPWNMTLGAVKDKQLIEQMGKQMAQQNKRLGIHFNFAPVVDINTNPKNPIIGLRSFGESTKNVTESAVALVKGIQSSGGLATAKHFPGHGDTDKDSHHALPVVNHSIDRILDVEVYPYKKLFKEGLASVMVAHLNVPALEPNPEIPSSLSYNVVTKFLKEELKFKGLIFTDALNMKGASNFKQPGEVDLAAFLAGNDILLFPEDVPKAAQVIKEAYERGDVSEERLYHSVSKILKYKFNIGLTHFKEIETNKIYEELNRPEDQALHYKIMENAITVLKNKGNVLPIQNIEKETIAYVKLGDDFNSKFVETLKKYTDITVVENNNTDSLLIDLKDFSTVIVGFHKSDASPWKKYDFTEEELNKIQKIAQSNKVILDVFSRAYSMMKIQNFEDIEGVILSYQNSEIAQDLSAQLIFGAFESKGKLPVSINSEFKVNDGLKTKKINRFGFTAPENVGLDSNKLMKIDSLANRVVTEKMAPGVQVLVARKGQVVYQKSFGTFSYRDSQEVKNSDLFDVASLTKIVSTLPEVMLQFDEGKIKLDTKLKDLLQEFKYTDKKDITLKELLSHNNGFVAWMPFYKKTLDVNNKPLDSLYSPTYNSEYPIQVTENLYLKKGYNDSIIKAIAESKLGEKSYKYSDFPFILLKEYLERESGKTLDVLVQEDFYKSVGASSMMYNPLTKFDSSEILPTEIDTYYRHQKIQGYVHDMASAMQGGVSGHAGIFANALDVAKIMQLYLNKGNYGNKQYFSEGTFNKFNKTYYDIKKNRRALGFDKPGFNGEGPTCNCVSSESFGHTGFTGTYAWADPETEIVYVFLSNRTFPDANAENKLSKERIRVKIQQVIQDAIIN